LKTLNVRNIGILVKDRSDSTSQHTFVTWYITNANFTKKSCSVKALKSYRADTKFVDSRRPAWFSRWPPGDQKIGQIAKMKKVWAYGQFNTWHHTIPCWNLSGRQKNCKSTRYSKNRR
jgi:hypothetical protein